MKVLVLTGMYPTREDPAFGRFVAEQVRALEREGPALRCDVLFFNGRASRLNYLRAAVELRRRLRSGGHDLVHAHYGLAGLVAVSQSRAPAIITLHGSDAHVPWQRALTCLAVRRARAVIAVSASVRDLIRDDAAREVPVIPCGIDFDRFHPVPLDEARARLGWNRRAPVLLFPGDPGRRVKGYRLFSEVLASVRRAGFSADEAVLKAVPPERVPAVMNACDVMVMTSRSEGSPMVVKEAMACNLPVVSLDVGDVAEVAGGSRNCAVLPLRHGALGCAAALAAAVVEVLSSGGRSDGRARVGGLSLRATARRVLEVYREALSPRPSHALSAARTAPVDSAPERST